MAVVAAAGAPWRMVWLDDHRVAGANGWAPAAQWPGPATSAVPSGSTASRERLHQVGVGELATRAARGGRVQAALLEQPAQEAQVGEIDGAGRLAEHLELLVEVGWIVWHGHPLRCADRRTVNPPRAVPAS